MSFYVLFPASTSSSPTGIRTTGSPPAGASSFHLRLSPVAVAKEVSVIVEVLQAPSVSGLVFWALQVDLLNSAGIALGVAHTGLQYYPGFPSNGAVNWGGYDASGIELTGSTSALPSATSNPNTRNYAWQTGRKYRYRVFSPSPGLWRATITDLVTNITTTIRDLTLSGAVTLGRQIVWTESFVDCGATHRARWSDPSFVLPNNSTVSPTSATATYQSYENGGCTNTNSSVDVYGLVQAAGVTRTNPHGTVLSVAQPTGEFTVVQGRVQDPSGTPYWGAGMNVATSITYDGGNPGPYVFEGVSNGTYDIWPGAANNGTWPGGGVTAGLVWSPEGGGPVTLPDRAYALNGTYSAAAQAAGIANPTDHWHQKIMRVTTQPRSGDGAVTPAVSVPKYMANVQQLLDLGFVVMPEIHNMTGGDIQISTNWKTNPSIASSSISATSARTGSTGAPDYAPFANLTAATQALRDAVDFTDAVVAQFGTDGNGGTTAKAKGYVWIDLPNEPFTGARSSAYDDFVVAFVRRIRAAGAHNIINIPLPGYAQHLGAIANGDLDSLRTTLQGYGVDWNLVWTWHAYGADAGTGSGGGYTGSAGYARMDAHLSACFNGSPGGHRWAISIGEYGEATPNNWGNAGPWAWNVAAVDCLVTNTYGTPLAEKWPVFPIAWHGTGDQVYWKLFKLCYGPDGVATETNGQGTPIWDIDGTNLARLTRFGRAHWDTSHNIWSKTS